MKLRCDVLQLFSRQSVERQLFGLIIVVIVKRLFNPLSSLSWHVCMQIYLISCLVIASSAAVDDFTMLGIPGNS